MEVVKNFGPVLKNEFTLNKENLQKLFSSRRPVYVMGYGSLLFPAGWLGRKMLRPPRKLIECVCSGFERGPWGLFQGVNFYGIIRTNGSHLNAVLGRVRTMTDYIGLMDSERAVGLHKYANYRVVDVTEEVSAESDLPNDATIHAVVNRPSNRKKIGKTFPMFGYYEYVWGWLNRMRGEEFAKEFLKTGGFKNSREVFDSYNPSRAHVKLVKKAKS